MRKCVVLMWLMMCVITISGCSGCSGRLAPEAERAMNRDKYSMNNAESGAVQAGNDAAEQLQEVSDEPTFIDDEPAGEAGEQSEDESRGGARKTVQAAGNLEMPARLSHVPEQILRKKAYVVSFNNETLIPNWVAWKLTREATYGRLNRNTVKFQEEYDVEPQYRVTTNDYSRSGYDRGHMCPAGDNKWDQQALQECFRMTNMCPQLHSLNSGDWNDLEILCREWARAYGEIYIVCGPIVSKHATKKIGRQRKITVPTGFFKVVLCMKGTPKAIGFIFDHEGTRRDESEYVQSVDQVERITGMDFFPALPDNVENKVEAQANFQAW